MSMIAILSDIHGNREALAAVLKDARECGAAEYWCLGDIVGYGASPNECCEKIREIGAKALLGNHDYASAFRVSLSDMTDVAQNAMRWTRKELSDENRLWLRTLPFTRTEGDVTLVHGSLADVKHWAYVFDEVDAIHHFAAQETGLCFNGHTHAACFFLQFGKNTIGLMPRTVQYVPGCRMLVNVGSVGQPRDESPDASYCLYNPGTRVVLYRRVPYDIAAAADRIRKAGLPSFLADRLAVGH